MLIECESGLFYYMTQLLKDSIWEFELCLLMKKNEKQIMTRKLMS